MPRVKQASKRKRTSKAAAVKALGAAGLSFSLVGGASGSTMPTADNQPNHRFIISEEEMADVSLATFRLFDRENSVGGVRLARGGCGGYGGVGHGSGGCGNGGRGAAGNRGCGSGGFVAGRGCGGCRGFAGCGCTGCGFGFGDIWVGGTALSGCCASWGACRTC